MKFLIDAQLPRAVCSWLADRGHQGTHVLSLSGHPLLDDVIAQMAVRDCLVIMSKDEDFVELCRRYPFSLVWIRCGNTTKNVLRAWLEERWAHIEASLEAGNTFLELH